MLGIAIQNTLTDMGIENACIGGFPRDLKLGRKPNDYDIFIWGDKSQDCLQELAKRFGGHYQDSYFHNPTLKYILRVGGKVDIICSKLGSERDILNSLDFNINQYKLVDGKPVFLGKNEGQLYLLHHTVPQDRRDKVRDLAKGWKIVVDKSSKL